jgi:hypothetical protein
MVWMDNHTRDLVYIYNNNNNSLYETFNYLLLQKKKYYLQGTQPWEQTSVTMETDVNALATIAIQDLM